MKMKRLLEKQMFIYQTLQLLLKMSVSGTSSEWIARHFLQSSLQQLLSLRRDPSLTSPVFRKLMTSSSSREINIKESQYLQITEAMPLVYYMPYPPICKIVVQVLASIPMEIQLPVGCNSLPFTCPLYFFNSQQG